MTNGVVATSIDLPVKERIAQGLGHVGVRITLSLIMQLCVFVLGSLTTVDGLRVCPIIVYAFGMRTGGE